MMDWRERNDLARLALLSARFTTKSGHARTDCPFCFGAVGKDDRKQCLAIHTVSGWYRCWRCNTHGKLDDMGEDDGGSPTAPAAPAEDVLPPDGFMALGDEPALSAMCTEDARRYLASRGLGDVGLWKAAGIGCCLDGRFGGRVVVPILSPDARWRGWVGRAWVKRSDRPYMNAPGMTLGTVGGLYNEAALHVESDEPALAMEGVFDALAYWPDAAAVLGKPTEAQIRTLVSCARPVVMVLDGDAWEEAWAIAMRLRFDGQRAGYVKLPPRIDPDEVDRAWLRAEARKSLEAAL